MLKSEDKIAVFAEGALGTVDGKMAEGVMRYSPNRVVAAVDSEKSGKSVRDFIPSLERDIPVVADIDRAIELGANVLVLGTAPSGGRIPSDWLPMLESAIRQGVSIVNGLHDQVSSLPDKPLDEGQWIWNVRQTPSIAPTIAMGRARSLTNIRCLMVGTDMAIGKMTAGLEIYKALRDNGTDVKFLATGQIGITVTGTGIPLDAYIVDQACGAVEQMVMENSESDVLIVEGQGSLLHPGSTATLPLMRGSCANRLILCHKAGMEHLDLEGDVRVPPIVKVPPIKDVIALNEAVASAAGALIPAKVVGIALNTKDLSDEEARTEICRLSAETGLPVEDVVRFGAGKLAETLLPRV